MPYDEMPYDEMRRSTFLPEPKGQAGRQGRRERLVVESEEGEG